MMVCQGEQPDPGVEPGQRPGAATFSRPLSAASHVSFTKTGLYVLRLTASDGDLSGNGDVKVTVVDDPFPRRKYSTDADFDEGTLTGVAHLVPDQLELMNGADEGTWSVVADSRLALARWAAIGWDMQVCAPGAMEVILRVGEDGLNFGPPSTAVRGQGLSLRGRYLKIEVSFHRAAGGQSPVLFDLTVLTQGSVLDPLQNQGPRPGPGGTRISAGRSPCSSRGDVRRRPAG